MNTGAWGTRKGAFKGPKLVIENNLLKGQMLTKLQSMKRTAMVGKLGWRQGESGLIVFDSV